MSVQQNVVTFHGRDRQTVERVAAQIAREQVRAVVAPADDEASWLLLVESHALMGEQIVGAVLDADGAESLQLHALTEAERLRLLAGSDPWAELARG